MNTGITLGRGQGWALVKWIGVFPKMGMKTFDKAWISTSKCQADAFQIAQSYSVNKKFTPRRAMMYVPGNDERKIAKIPKLGADCVVLDCEDGVAVSKKEEARLNIRKHLDQGSIDFGRSECTVRVNSVDSGLCEEDMKVILTAKNLPNSILLPKVDSVNQLAWFVERSRELLSGKNLSQKVNLIIFIESGRSILSLPNICETAWNLSQSSNFVPDALVFGSDDFCADIGATRTKWANELTYARQHIVLVAKAYKLQAIDIVYIDYKDIEGLKTQSLEGAQMGFTGKQLIHPGQVEPCQQAFTPSPEKIEWARELIAAFEEHSKTGKGAFNFRGSMIDMPLVLQAQNISQLAAQISGK